MKAAVRAIIIRNDEILVMHRNKFGTEYDTLPGGGIDMGETPEEALLRELKEETGVIILNYRKVYMEDAGDIYGVQHVFLCEYGSGEPILAVDSEEAIISKMGSNLYEPRWLKVADLAETSFVSPALKARLISDIANGFPVEVVSI